MEKLNLEKSKKLFEEAKLYIPNGITDAIKHPSYFIEGEYPIFIKSGKGIKVVDVDGNEYNDFLCSFGPVILGHREGEVDDAVVSQIREKGFCFALCQEYQNMLAKKLQMIIPCAEKSLFVISGSDASTAAVRIARAYTGRQRIIKCGYHGWHDWSSDFKNGIPAGTYSDVFQFNFNDINSLEEALKEGEPVAAVIMMPVFTPMGDGKVLEPEKGFLELAKELTHKYGAILIFDEVRTGFRMSLGGGQTYYGVVSDMVVLGKAMGNGYPISAVCGKSEIMMTTSKINVTSTFFSNSLGMIAALKTIEIMERENVLDTIWHLAKKLRSGIQEIIRETGFPIELSGPLPLSKIHFKKEGNYQERIKLFYTAMIRQGILTAPNRHLFIAFRHTEEDIEKFLVAVKGAIAFVKENTI